MRKLVFKEAESVDELQQVHALNHRVFAEEIGQHPIHPSGLLVDRLHAQNRYFIALRDDIVVGMISVNSGPEFSVAKRLPDARVLQELTRPLELRLLAVEPQERNRTVLSGLLWQAYDFAFSNGFSHLLISAITERESMYRKLGFRPLAPPIGEGAASFMPMVMQIVEQRRDHCRQILLHQRHWERTTQAPVSLMPGPVCVSERVIAAFASVPMSHRSPDFVRRYERVRSLLKGLLSGSEVALFPGSGTLANDAVGANLKALFGDRSGLIISNGEFGERIANQADKAGLVFRRLSFPWGSPWSLSEVEDAADQKPAWIWAVQIETSTGVLNPTDVLLKLARQVKSAVALDCVSSVGAVPIANEGGPLFFASGVSGKSLGAYAGLAFVYLSEQCRYLLSKNPLCPSFNLLRMCETSGPTCTVPSSLVFALRCSLEEDYQSPDAAAQRMCEYFTLGQYVRSQLRCLGLAPIAPESSAAPNITTFALPDPLLTKRCLEAGFQIASESQYLQSRKWGQIATMGNVTIPSLERLFRSLSRNRMPEGADHR